MKTFTAIVEQDSDTNLYVDYVPGFSGLQQIASDIECRIRT